MRIIVRNEEEMLRVGCAIARVLEKKDTVYLLGELGAGKTTLVRGIARGLGYQGRVTSPTFTIMNIYESVPLIYHFDFYRLESGEVGDLGLDDYLERDGLSIIEWPQAGEMLLPGEALIVEILLVDNDYERERILNIKGLGDRYDKKLEELARDVDTGY